MRSRSRAAVGAALFGAVVIGLLAPWPIRPSVIDTNQLIVTGDMVLDEDVYVSANSVIIEGTLDGDLVGVASRVFITGTVTGDVTMLTSGRVEVGGTVGGALRIVGSAVEVDGSVGDDVAVAALDLTMSGETGRDVLFFGGSAVITGTVGRNVGGQFLDGEVDGVVGGNVDVTTGGFTLGASADVAGDVLYRSSGEATISGGARVGGTLARLPVRFPFVVDLALRLAGIVSLFAFLVAGIALFWAFRRTAPAAVGSIAVRPGRTFLVGLGVVVLGPVAAVALAFTLVGLPLALLVLVMLALAVFFGPVPAVAALGDRVLRGRGGLLGGFVLGALVWRAALWLVPLVGLVVYALALVWGVGGWVTAAWEGRRRAAPAPLLPPDAAADEDVEDWEAPLPPDSPADDADEGSGGGDATRPEDDPEPADDGER